MSSTISDSPECTRDDIYVHVLPFLIGTVSRDFRPKLLFHKSNPYVTLILIFSQHLNIGGGAKKLLGVNDTDTVLQNAVSLIIRNVNDTAESKSRA